MDRRTFSLMAGSLALGPTGWAADGAWPQRPITLVVPFAAGSVVDVQARLIARGLATRLGQAIVVDNKVGVAGSLGAEAVARAARARARLPWKLAAGFATSTLAFASSPCTATKSFTGS